MLPFGSGAWLHAQERYLWFDGDVSADCRKRHDTLALLWPLGCHGLLLTETLQLRQKKEKKLTDKAPTLLEPCWCVNLWKQMNQRQRQSLACGSLITLQAGVRKLSERCRKEMPVQCLCTGVSFCTFALRMLLGHADTVTHWSCCKTTPENRKANTGLSLSRLKIGTIITVEARKASKSAPRAEHTA